MRVLAPQALQHGLSGRGGLASGCWGACLGRMLAETAGTWVVDIELCHERCGKCGDAPDMHGGVEAIP